MSNLLRKLFYCATATRRKNASQLYIRSIASVNKESVQMLDQRVTRLQRSGETFGQPTPFTHPHLLQKGELIQGITAEEIQGRRNRLMENIQKYDYNLHKKYSTHLIVIPSASKKYMSDKIPYVFRQNSDFLYFTGCQEPESVLVLYIDANQNSKSILFVRPKDKHSELWDGPRTGVENATNLFLVDEAFSVSDFSKVIPKFGRIDFLWYDNKCDQPTITEQINSIVSRTSAKLTEALTLFIHKQRVIKSESEIKLMRKTCEIASEAINKTIRTSKPGDSEHHIFATVDYHCRMNGASYLAYPPVVASGSNATTIHYINNSQIVNPMDLVLMDAGCEYGGYTSDITRTWPISGSFTQPQLVLYEIIHTVQKELISKTKNILKVSKFIFLKSQMFLDTLLREGGFTLDSLFDTMCLQLGSYLQEIGLIQKGLVGMDLAKAAYSYCPHHVSHYLGMDVHDTSTVSRSVHLQPGMVCTVEPGIYISRDRKDVPEEFRGIGIRIEDDVLVTSDNNIEVLTKACVKDPTLLTQQIRSSN
ncbi:Xaa-Pro aminopeptidase 3 [Pseudolycoriella hygida]|uniref:Xaa-Pro aminopeptidase 3 n=1 Tax=Pseudolycoriella hygida TaxID=35572 RepID=A0A9Q0MV77_9DIPT|nr:Xaa-Pro aminopeptidase 3 [Pseudolycoriella hygida]